MGASSSQQSQNVATFNKLTNTININSTNQLMNSAVMNSIKKCLIASQQSCKQSFDSKAILQISNLSSGASVNLSNINLDVQNIVKMECFNQSTLQTQTEDTFMSDNSAAMSTMLQSIGTNDFIQSISGSLKSKVDSMPLGFSGNATNVQNVNFIDNTTSMNIMQNIQNLYQSTSVNDTSLQSVNETYQNFINENKLIVNNITAGDNININVLSLNSIDKFDSSAKLVNSISNVIIQKLQSILGMKIEFTGQTSQTTNNNQTTTNTATSETTNQGIVGTVNNTIKGITDVFNTPKVIFISIAVVVGIVVIGIGGFFFLRRKKSGSGSIDNNINQLINYGKKFIQNDTLSLIKNYI